MKRSNELLTSISEYMIVSSVEYVLYIIKVQWTMFDANTSTFH